MLYYVNQESEDIIGGSTDTVHHSTMNISRNITAVFFKLATKNVHDNSYAAGPVSIKTNIPRFHLK